MSAGYVIPLCPHELASRFSDSYDPRYDAEDDPLDEDEDISTEEMETFRAFLQEGSDFESLIQPLLERIPEREADLIWMYFLQRKRQADIAAIFGVTQAAVSYRLDRGLQRIRFLLSIPQVTEAELRRDLPKVFKPSDKEKAEGTNIDVDILVGMWETTCQSEVASRLQLTQGRVRHRFFKAVKTLEKAAEKKAMFEPYSKIFSAIADKNFNVLREVKLPQWQGRGGDCCI